MPPLLTRFRYTRLSIQAHLCTIKIPNAKANRYQYSFISLTDKLWNGLPLSVLPNSYDKYLLAGSIRFLTRLWKPFFIIVL